MHTISHRLECLHANESGCISWVDWHQPKTLVVNQSQGSKCEECMEYIAHKSGEVRNAPVDLILRLTYEANQLLSIKPFETA